MLNYLQTGKGTANLYTQAQTNTDIHTHMHAHTDTEENR